MFVWVPWVSLPSTRWEAKGLLFCYCHWLPLNPGTYLSFPPSAVSSGKEKKSGGRRPSPVNGELVQIIGPYIRGLFNDRILLFSPQ